MKTIYFAAASFDGYLADKNDSLEWLFKNGPTDISFIDKFVETVGAIAMGSSTYRCILLHNESSGRISENSWMRVECCGAADFRLFQNCAPEIVRKFCCYLKKRLS